MIIAIRISGLVEVPKGIQESLFRLRLRKKYSAVLIKPTEENLSLLKKLRDYIAYGEINKEMLQMLIKYRAKPIKKSMKIDSSTIAEQLDKKSILALGLKPFFSLHPPRGGIESKVHFPIRKGVLGDNKEKINDLLKRML